MSQHLRNSFCPVDDEILQNNMQLIENDLCHMLEAELSTNYTNPRMQHQITNSHLKIPTQQVYPKNWSELASMSSNIFTSQGRSQEKFFKQLPVHIAQTHFDPRNCSNETVRTSYHTAPPTAAPIPYMSEFHDLYKNLPKISSNYNPSYIDFPNVNRSYAHHRAGQNFNKKYPRRSEASFTVVPKISTFNDENEEISLNVLQIGPKFRYQNALTKLLEVFQKVCFFLSGLANQRQEIEVNYFHTASDTSFLYDYSKNIDNNLLNNLNFVSKTTLSEMAMIEWILRNLEILCKEKNLQNFSAGESIIWDLSDSIAQLNPMFNLKIVLQQPYNLDKDEDEILKLIDGLDDLILSVKYAQTFLWTMKHLIKPDLTTHLAEPIDSSQREIFIGS